jgi:hypothetical protein
MSDLPTLTITRTALRLGAVIGLFNTRVPTGFAFVAYLTTGDRSLFLI